ncbi:histidine-specific methyltransferase [Gamsiella multidivaricata]|uniref:histidine-specific methyltransferase n=1 Tax=Gamsiella multidivaricata TaxID=101098 RepID=UPI002220A38D|nr:histidine-specific methyltransferase [Gamsiella multidivaricata]KAG0353309.1 hypothetical protein BGZ54_002299 [Gamsiella multidivaricata]KAI7825338.1 histidine-specific methyltransferase [Gamsiella multidivaricata]
MPESTPSIVDIRNGSPIKAQGHHIVSNDSGTVVSHQEPEIVPTKDADNDIDLAKVILDGLCPKQRGQPKTIPTIVLYDDRGLQLFDEITYLEEYYLTHEEIEILEHDADKIVDHIPDNSVIVELGAGSLRKTVLLLNAVERKRKNVVYYALDLMLDELTKSLKSLGQFNNIKIVGLWGTYDQGIAFVSSIGPEIPKTLLWLGSSIGSYTREDAAHLLVSYRQSLNKGDNWLIGIDRRNDPQEITLAYNDSKGVTREFILNGLDHANVLLGQQVLDRDNFGYYGRYNEEEGRHEAYYKVKKPHQMKYRNPATGQEIVVDMAEDELINMEYSYKWSPQETAQLFQQTRLMPIGQWTSSSKRYDLHLVSKMTDS